jgi:protein-disulfide isomerase
MLRQRRVTSLTLALGFAATLWLTPAHAVGPAAPQRAPQSELDRRFLEAWAQQRRVDVGVPAAGAKVVIVKFNDWMCPGCKFWYENLKPILAKYEAKPGAIKYVEKDWPWNSKCNAAVSQTIPGHEASCDAAAAVRIAADHGKREIMLEWLYANQPETPEARQTMPDRVRAKAAELLGVKDFPAAAVLKMPLIAKDVADGRAADVRSTPTYFINGIRAADEQGGVIPIHYFDIAIQFELERAGVK